MGLEEDAKKFAERAEEFNRTKSGKGSKRKKQNRGLKGEAQEFSKNAKRLAEKMRPAQPTLDEMPTQEVTVVGRSKDLEAKMYAEANIIPPIDSLIDRHRDGSGIPKSEIEATFKDIVKQMVQDNILTKEEMEAYLAPLKVEREVQVDTGRTEMRPKQKEDRGLGNRFLNFVSGNEVEMEEVKIFETRKVIVDGPSQLQQDIDSSMEFKGDKLESPNLQSFKDKLMNGLSKLCNSLGLKDLAKSCRQSISTGNLEKIYQAEAGLSSLTSKVVEQAKVIGQKAGTPEAKRVAERTQDALAKRQQPKNSGYTR